MLFASENICHIANFNMNARVNTWEKYLTSTTKQIQLAMCGEFCRIYFVLCRMLRLTSLT